MKEHLSEEELDALEYKLLIEWLESIPTPQWHVFVHNWNFDNANDILRWLADNPRTEQATALLIYWMLGARFYKRYATAAAARAHGASVEKLWLFIHQLEANYLRDFYAAGTVGFDPTHDSSPGFIKPYDWTANYQDEPAALPIPAPLLAAVPGIQPPPGDWVADAEEGIPAHICEQLDAYREDDYEDEGEDEESA